MEIDEEKGTEIVWRIVKHIADEVILKDEGVRPEGVLTQWRMWYRVRMLGDNSKHLSKDEKNFIIKLREKYNLSMHDIAYVTCRSSATIQKILKENGLSERI